MNEKKNNNNNNYYNNIFSDDRRLTNWKCVEDRLDLKTPFKTKVIPWAFSVCLILDKYYSYLDPGPRIICRFLLSLDNEKKKGGSTLDKRLQVCMTIYILTKYAAR
jgi:hypothetical protein